MAEKKSLTEVFNERKEKREAVAESGTSAVEKLTQSDLPPSRRGKSRLETWVTRDAKKQLRLLAVEAEKSQDQLLRDGLNMLFKAHGIPPIA